MTAERLKTPTVTGSRSKKRPDAWMLHQIAWVADFDRTFLRVFSPVLSESSGIGVEDELDFVPHAAKCVSDFFFCSRGVGGVVESPVVAVHLTRKLWTGLIGIPADRDDGIDVPFQKLIHVF